MRLTILFLLLTAVSVSFAQTTAPSIPISRADKSKYTVEGNIPYGPHPSQMLDMLYAKDAGANGAGPYPGVIMFHGGGWIRTDKATMSSFYNRFLAHGFVVCNVEYRMAGKDSSGAYTATSALAPAAVEDALTAAKWFADHAAQYHVDPNRIVVSGASAGGHLALMVGLCTPDAKLGPTAPADFKIAAIVNGYGPADMAEPAEHDAAAKQWIPESLPDRADLIRRISPVSYARKDIPPLLTVIGANDHGLSSNQKLVEMLKADGADAQIHVVAGAGHGFNTPPTAWPDAEKTMFDFLAAKGIISSVAP